jgi:hypothetical protein
MNSIRQAFDSSKTRSTRTYRWVAAWLVVSAVIALLLLSNSIRDYRFVFPLIAREQVRHHMGQRAAALERQLRPRSAYPQVRAVNSLLEARGTPLWIELRGLDDTVLEHTGGVAQKLFSEGEERS